MYMYVYFRALLLPQHSDSWGGREQGATGTWDLFLLLGSGPGSGQSARIHRHQVVSSAQRASCLSTAEEQEEEEELEEEGEEEEEGGEGGGRRGRRKKRKRGRGERGKGGGREGRREKGGRGEGRRERREGRGGGRRGGEEEEKKKKRRKKRKKRERKRRKKRKEEEKEEGRPKLSSRCGIIQKQRKSVPEDSKMSLGYFKYRAVDDIKLLETAARFLQEQAFLKSTQLLFSSKR